MLQFSFNVSNVHLILSHLMWGDPQNKQNEFQVWTLLPYLMKKKKKKQVEYHVWTHIQWKWRKAKWISSMNNRNSRGNVVKF